MPPDTAPVWADNPAWMQAMLLAYSEIRDHEELQRDIALASRGMM